MGLMDWYHKKKQEFDKVSDQVKADMLRKQMRKEKKQGSVAWAFVHGMKPWDFGKLKYLEYMNKKHEQQNKDGE